MRFFNRFSKRQYALFAITALAVVFFAWSVHAQTINTGLQFGAQTGLANQDFRITIAKIIRIILGFLGVIAVGLTMYAGFIWMTAKGNDEKIQQAKGILKNAIIGLAIILSSFAIVSFILSRLLAATTGNGLNGNGGNGNNGSSGLSGLGNGIVKSVYPAPFQGQNPGTSPVPRNTSIIITFREPMQAQSVCVDVVNNKCAPGSKIQKNTIKIFMNSLGDGEQNVKDVAVSSNDNQTFVLKPAGPNYLGFQNDAVDYTVFLTEELRKADGNRAFSLNGFRWSFKVGTALDFTPPKILGVSQGGIFPLPDDEADSISGSQPATAATGTVTVNGQPSVNQTASASITQTSPPVDPVAGKQTAMVEGTNTCAVGTISFSIINGSHGLAARVAYSQAGMVPADLDIVNNRFAIAPCNLTVVFRASPAVGNAWSLAVRPAGQTDTLTLGSKIYSFVNSNPSGNQILVGGSLEQTADNIAAAVAVHPELSASVQNRVVTFKAKVLGVSGNNLEISTTSTGLATGRMGGGGDAAVSYKINDKKDQPKNTVIQINFDEAINPLVIAGTSSELADKLSIVNADKLDERSGAACTKDNDCRSFKCSNGSCQGDELAGTFMVSNQYKTVEFVSNNKCGVNGCGESIYCLPPNANLRIDVAAASLRSCASDNDCSAPFSSCASGVCQDSGTKKNAPTASGADGILDASDNSLDGNRNDNPQGKVDTWNENASSDSNAGRGDNYRWSFWTNDKLDLTPPLISQTTVKNNDSRVPLTGLIKVTFSKLMMSASLSTGTVIANNGLKEVVHKLINMWSLSNTPIGYWISKEEGEVAPADGQPDYTIAVIGHGLLSDSTAYRSQVGSGVKDIYQNCYKPSGSLSCNATAAAPSCCRNAEGRLVPTAAELTPEGNCP